ncbi:MAG: peroxidase-related enzyme [Gemmatimonadaceae bacterium]|nr:peroxidase-related enzyme [Gemmatimonadaceae bacterium]
MAMFPSLPQPPQLDSVFRRFPYTAPPLLEFHDRVLRDPSPLTVAERELIAAYVSGLNACTYCHGSHVIAAEAFGIEPALVSQLLENLDAPAVRSRLTPILHFVRKLTLTPSRMTEADAAAVYAEGWEEQALFDAISVCALFNFMNRLVEGLGVQVNPLAMSPEDVAARRARMAEPGDDPYQAPRSYSALLQRWGLA